MRIVKILAALGLLAVVAAPARAADLEKIDRTIAKLPQLTSERPEYCLLVFGPDAHKRVWLIHDGDILYVDRNGNGDLTEPGERVTAQTDYGDREDGVFEFKAGDIPDGELIHKHLRVTWYHLDHLIDSDPKIKALLTQNPKWRGCVVSVDVDVPGQHGEGIYGRVAQLAGSRDNNGPFQFGPRPEEAPVVHFSAPWQITFYSAESPWHIGATEKPILQWGHPGLVREQLRLWNTKGSYHRD